MNIGEYQNYIVMAAILLYVAWRWKVGKKMKAEIPKFLEAGAIVVDVRSPAEFSQGARPGSINIPLDLLPKKLNTLDKSKKIILCCASGARSGMALGILKSAGYSDVINAGPWTNTLV
jgi:phage shock protein E